LRSSQASLSSALSHAPPGSPALCPKKRWLLPTSSRRTSILPARTTSNPLPSPSLLATRRDRAAVRSLRTTPSSRPSAIWCTRLRDGSTSGDGSIGTSLIPAAAPIALRYVVASRERPRFEGGKARSGAGREVSRKGRPPLPPQKAVVGTAVARWHRLALDRSRWCRRPRLVATSPTPRPRRVPQPPPTVAAERCSRCSGIRCSTPRTGVGGSRRDPDLEVQWQTARDSIEEKRSNFRPEGKGPGGHGDDGGDNTADDRDDDGIHRTSLRSRW
jgi:hypothetical protein